MSQTAKNILVRLANALQKALAEYGEFEGKLDDYKDVIDSLIIFLFENEIELNYNQRLSYDAEIEEDDDPLSWNMKITPCVQESSLSSGTVFEGIYTALRKFVTLVGDFGYDDKKIFYGRFVKTINDAEVGVKLSIVVVASETSLRADDANYKLKIEKLHREPKPIPKIVPKTIVLPKMRDYGTAFDSEKSENVSQTVIGVYKSSANGQIDKKLKVCII